MKYHIEKGILPVLPGDYVWIVDDNPACLVRAVRVKEVALNDQNELTIREVTPSVGWWIRDRFFLSAEEAEREAAKRRKKPPFRFSDQAVSWMPAEIWIPTGRNWYGVRIRGEDGSETRREAWYDDDVRYPDERGFYESDRKSAARLENVTAWIDPEYIETDEWYDGKPLDFSYAGIEELDLDNYIWISLKKNGINTIRDIYRTDRETFLKTGILSRKRLDDLAEKLAEAGLPTEW